MMRSFLKTSLFFYFLVGFVFFMLVDCHLWEYFHSGTLYAQSYQPQEAERFYESLSILNPYDPIVLLMASIAYRNLGEHKAALKAYRKAVSLDRRIGSMSPDDLTQVIRSMHLQ